MSALERVGALTMLIPVAIWAGMIVLYAVERVNLWAKMPIDQYVVDFRRSIYRADPLQPILAIIAIIGGVVFALNTGAPAELLAWLGVSLIVLVIAMSIALPERINSQFRRREEGETPPNVEVLRTRWRIYHFIRVIPTIGALISLVLAVTFA